MSQRKKITPKKKLSATDQERVLQQLHNKYAITTEPNTESKKKVQRVTVDFPTDIYKQMKEETAENGQTLKGFIVSLVRNHFRS